MVNSYRGEVQAIINDKPMTLVLTLGALAELEARLGLADLQALGEKLSHGTISSKDALEIIRAGLRGAGTVLSDQELAQLRIGGGPKGALRLVIELLTVTFGDQN